MPADLREVLAILNRNHYEKTSLVTLLCSDAPAARNCEREVKDVAAAGRINGHYRIFDIRALLQPDIDRLESLSRLGVDDVCVVDDWVEGNGEWNRRLRRSLRARVNYEQRKDQNQKAQQADARPHTCWFFQAQQQSRNSRQC